ncbi:unnamed protein product, partial [Mesorhabditis belari]|uniref:Actin-related protein 10 n=1 Tax=Mesorhabditis belari TaxID=2138241 RepID=A0AAF3FNV8_9BILA
MANDSDLERIQRSDSSMSRQSVALSSLSLTSAVVNTAKPPIVLSIGSRIIRCGVAGEFEPRYSILTKELCPNATIDQLSTKDGLKIAESLLKRIFFDIMTIDSRGGRVLIVESPFCPTNVRNVLCQTLMEKLDVGQVSFAPSPLMATLPFNILTAFVLEVGHSEVLAMPINENVTMISQCYLSQRTGRAVFERAAQLLRIHARVEENGQQRELSDQEWSQHGENFVEKFVEQYAFCTTRTRATEIKEKGNEVVLQPRTAEARIRFGALMVMVPGFVRETVFEVFFDEDDPENFTDPSIPKMVHNAILRCPIDMRRKFFESLLVCGGLARATGFLSRLKEEIIAISTKKSTICGMEPKFFHFKEAKAEPMLGWIGGSLLAACQYSLQIRSISRDDWNKTKRVPDWTDFISEAA